MSLLPFSDLPRYGSRNLVPEGIDLGDWSAVEPLFDRLESEVRSADSAAALEKFLIDWGELSAALDEESSRRYIAMTCHTDDAEAEKAYLQFVEQIEPRTKPRQFELDRHYLSHPLRADLPRPRYDVFDRNTQVQVELFRKENIPLETEETRVGQQYQKLTGSLTVEFHGEERTLVQMGRYLEEPDRSTRQEAWERIAERRLREAPTINSQFEALLKIRRKIAANAGFESPRDYYFRRLARFDYSPADCAQFHAGVEECVVPLVRRLHQERQSRLDLDRLRPWDLSVDPGNRPPLRPFTQTATLLKKTQRLFDALDPALGRHFAQLRKHHLLDLDNRKGKAPGGYQCTLAEARLPFIFMNAVGQQRDVETLLHEAGHAFHALQSAGEMLYAYRAAIPIEFCEVASMSMELFGSKHLELFYDAAEARRARKTHLEGIVTILPWIATIDAFQHWIYTHPGSPIESIREAWLELMDRFDAGVDWSGYAEARALLWHRQLHLFLYPFYYIEYGIAQLGALQLWAHFRDDQGGALEAYRHALALGGSRPLPELFAAAGCRFEFGPKRLQPLMDLLHDELNDLADA